jgi:hypothetical protein
MKTAASQLLLASLTLGSAVPKEGKNHPGIGKNDFIKVDGLRLYDSNNSLYYLTGKKSHYCASKTATDLSQE